jgi:hypothetical protein
MTTHLSSLRRGAVRTPLLLALSLAATSGGAQQPAPTPAATPRPISEQEFQSGIVDKTVNLTTTRGVKVKLQLEKDGRSVVSLGFNDVGRWRPNGQGAYCIRWNKLPAEDRCAAFVRQDGQLALLQADGQMLKVDGVE